MDEEVSLISDSNDTIKQAVMVNEEDKECKDER